MYAVQNLCKINAVICDLY